MGIPGFASFLRKEVQKAGHPRASDPVLSAATQLDFESSLDSPPTDRQTASTALAVDRLHRVDLSAVASLFRDEQLQRIATSREDADRSTVNACSSPTAADLPRPLTLLVDTYAVLYYCLSLGVSRGALPSLHFLMPEYTYIREQIAWLEAAFRRHHIHLVWYVDAAGIGSIKESEHIRRSSQKVSSMTY